MTGDLENEAALDHPGNAVVKPLTVGLDAWEAHELGGDNNTTNRKNVTLKGIALKLIDLSLFIPKISYLKNWVRQNADLTIQNRSRGQEFVLHPTPQILRWLAS